MATKTRRLEIRAEDAFIETLERLARESGTTKAGVIDAAVNLLSQALEKAAEGKVITYVPKNRITNETDIVSTAAVL